MDSGETKGKPTKIKDLEIEEAGEISCCNNKNNN
jgi:hypothetical protein